VVRFLLADCNRHDVTRQRLALGSACAIGFAFSANYTNHAPVATALAAKFGFNLAAAGLLTTGIFSHPRGHADSRWLSGRPLGPSLCSRSRWRSFVLAIWRSRSLPATGSSVLRYSSALEPERALSAGARYIATVFAGPRLHLSQGLYGGSILLGSGS